MVLALLRGTTRQRQVKVPEARKSSCSVCLAWGLRYSKLALGVLEERARELPCLRTHFLAHISLCVPKIGFSDTVGLQTGSEGPEQGGAGAGCWVSNKGRYIILLGAI